MGNGTDEPAGGGFGIVVVGNDAWSRAVRTTVRRLGCRWPVQVWCRPGEPVPESTDDDVFVDTVSSIASFGLDPATPVAEVALACTTFDKVVVLPPRVYPCRPPCRSKSALRRTPVTRWDDAGPLLVDRGRRGEKAVTCLALILSTGVVYRLGGAPAFVRVTADLPGDDLPGGAAVRTLLQKS